MEGRGIGPVRRDFGDDCADRRAVRPDRDGRRGWPGRAARRLRPHAGRVGSRDFTTGDEEVLPLFVAYAGTVVGNARVTPPRFMAA